MLTRLWIVLSCLPLALLVGCGGGSSAAKCVAGATAECACPGQQSGVQTCTSAGTFAACVCGTSTDDAGGSGAAGGTSGAGGGAGGIGGAGGTTSSTGGTTSAIGGTTANGCSTCSIGLVCERYDNACLDPSWDEWPIPNSQADVTAGAPNGESYTDNGDGTVTDNVTGLMWQQAVPSTNYTWANAAAYCPTLTLAGHSDWRLPSVIELVSIVDLGQSSPSINGTYFPNTPGNSFWSSSPVAGSPSYAWGVDFYYGDTGYVDVSSTANVRCVR